jgi:hypothetical protein
MLHSKFIQSLSLALLVGFTACNTAPETTQRDTAQGTEKEAKIIPANTKKDNTGDEKAAIAFETTEFNFGEIRAGEKVNYKFKFKNTGNAPLVIENAQASCGCTVPDYSKAPIEPNGTGEIAIQFDSSNKDGKQDKTVTVKSNTETPSITLNVRGFVRGKVDMNGPLLTPNKK